MTSGAVLLSTDFPAPKASSRLAGATGALVLQGGFILLFVYSMPAFQQPANLAREFTLILPRRPMVVPPPLLQATPSKAQIPAISETPHTVSPSAPVVPPGAIPGIETFGQALNGCAPEKYNSLTPDQRARCPRPGAGVAIQEEPNLMGAPSHVKDEAHWQEELAREKSPALLPCGGFVDIICLLGKIADGSLGDFGDPSKWPHYAVKQLPPEDFYKIEQAYDAWHKAHR